MGKILSGSAREESDARLPGPPWRALREKSGMQGRLPCLLLASALWFAGPADAGATARIVSLSPDKGPVAGGTAVLIEVDESLILGPIRVAFGDRPARQVRRLGLSILQVTAPPGAPGPVPVRVSYGLWGSSTAPAVFTYVSPAPRLARVAPSTVPAGSEDLTLSLEGQNFTAGSGVRVGGTPVPSTYLDPQHLQARVPAALLAKAGSLDVRVTDPILAGGTSDAVSLGVLNPLPQLTAVEAPPLQAAGAGRRAPPAPPGGPDCAAAPTLTARGQGFRPESSIQLAGRPVPTRYRSDRELTATIPPERLATPGELAVQVLTPGPGGGASRTMSLAVSAPFPGRFLVFTSNRRGNRNHIFLLDRQTGRLDPLGEANSSNSNDGYPSISGDGRFIAFQSDRHRGQADVLLFDRETRRLDPLPELNDPDAFDGFPRISPDGRLIVFESDRLNGRPKIFLFDRQDRRLSEMGQANEATAEDGLAAISN